MLKDIGRTGRPATYTPEQMSTVVAVSLTNPRELGLPFACWTLDRLEAYPNEVTGIAIKRSRIDDIAVGVIPQLLHPADVGDGIEDQRYAVEPN
ncbi:MAG: helix-turn-helix domain-containing protein [Chloroflexi bacterium]|nr:helix-turn-helix domain-containing protein [Chloroflexota bacterium]